MPIVKLHMRMWKFVWRCICNRNWTREWHDSDAVNEAGTSELNSALLDTFQKGMWNLRPCRSKNWRSTPKPTLALCYRQQCPCDMLQEQWCPYTDMSPSVYDVWKQTNLIQYENATIRPNLIKLPHLKCKANLTHCHWTLIQTDHN